MRRASYRFGVQWVARNDEPTCRHVDDVAGFISTLLLADLFDVDPHRVAEDIVRIRERQSCEEEEP